MTENRRNRFNKDIMEKKDPAEGLRESLKDLAVILEALGRVCPNTEELHGVVQLALENDGQLRLILNAIQTTNQRR